MTGLLLGPLTQARGAPPKNLREMQALIDYFAVKSRRMPALFSA